MDNNSNDGLGCVMGCWLFALVAGILLAALMMIMGGFAFTPAAFFGLLLFVLLGAFMSYAICSGGNAAHGAGVAATGAAASGVAATRTSGTASTGSAAASASADAVTTGADSGAAAVAAGAGTTAAGISSGTTLSGEDELAGRKGDWKYEGDAKAEAPAAKKAPAKKAAAKPAAKKAAAKPAAKKAAKPAAAKATAKPAAKKAKPVAKDGKPELLKKARAGGPDDLKQIKGVGPKMEGMLHTMGVFHFDQVASWRKAEVQWVDDNLEGFKGRVSRDEWVKQAKILAKGGTTEFSKKVDKGGVY